MPEYRNRCVRCGHEWDNFQRMADEIPPCPECGGPASRLIQAVPAHFHATGFYATEYERVDDLKAKARPKDGPKRRR
jgi:putative FmdB family regulatory protein